MPRMDKYEGTLRESSDVSGVYRARVEDNEDPLHIGRVKIRVPMLHGFEENGVSKKNLPWASYCSNSGGYGYGSFLVPEVGEYVFVVFEDNDSYKPVYIGSSFGAGSSAPKKYISNGDAWYGVPGSNEVPKDAQRSDVSKKIIYKTPKGASFEMDETDGKESISMIDSIGQTVKIESNLANPKHQRAKGDIEENESYASNTKGSRIAIIGSGKQKIEITTKGDKVKFYIGDKDKKTYIEITPDEDNGILVKSDKNIEVDSEKNITATSDKNVIVKGAKSVSVSSDSAVELSAPSIVLNGNVTIVE